MNKNIFFYQNKMEVLLFAILIKFSKSFEFRHIFNLKVILLHSERYQYPLEVAERCKYCFDSK